MKQLNMKSITNGHLIGLLCLLDTPNCSLVLNCKFRSFIKQGAVAGRGPDGVGEREATQTCVIEC